MSEDLWICPGCGTELRVGVRGCPTCAKRSSRRHKQKAMARKSRGHDLSHDAVDLPDDDFDYKDFVSREFGRVPHRKLSIKWYWWVTAAVLFGLMGLGLIRLG